MKILNRSDTSKDSRNINLLKFPLFSLLTKKKQLGK